MTKSNLQNIIDILQFYTTEIQIDIKVNTEKLMKCLTLTCEMYNLKDIVIDIDEKKITIQPKSKNE